MAAAAVVLAGAGVGIAAALGAFSSSSEQQVEEALRTFHKAVVDQNAQGAYDMLCAEEREWIQDYLAQSEVTFEEYMGDYFSFGEIVSFEIDVSDVTVLDDGQTAEMTADGAIHGRDGQVENFTDVTDVWVNEDGTWKLC